MVGKGKKTTTGLILLCSPKKVCNLNYIECVTKWHETLRKRNFSFLDFSYVIIKPGSVVTRTNPLNAKLEELVRNECFVKIGFLYGTLEQGPLKYYMNGEDTETVLKDFIFNVTGLSVENVYNACSWKDDDKIRDYSFIFS